MKRTVIFGGSFDPPHNGHLNLLKAAVSREDVEKAVVVPAGRNPLKQHGAAAGSQDRLAMVRLAFSKIAVIETWELEREGPSFTVETLKHLHREYGFKNKPYLLAGDDILDSFHRWKDITRILELAELLVGSRRPDALCNAPDFITILKNPVKTVSSTQVRRQILEGPFPTDLIPEPVADYIVKKDLYRHAR